MDAGRSGGRYRWSLLRQDVNDDRPAAENHGVAMRIEPQIDAVAADMSLQAIKGKVTGKQSGRSMLVRSLSGIGETAAMMVGAPSANSAFSENDLLRMRVADNFGNAGDEQIMRMMTMQHIVVSVPAGTEIYVIFEKASAVSPASEKETVQVPPAVGSLPESIAATQP